MRKINKYISKEKMCNLVVNRAEKLFELSSEESNYLRNRLKKYDKMELQHLYHNFTPLNQNNHLVHKMMACKDL